MSEQGLLSKLGQGLAAAALLLAAEPLLAANAAADAADPHAAHRAMMANNDVKRSVVAYKVPPLKLVRDDGTAVQLDKELDDGRIVVLNFIYTDCTTICPLTSQVFGVLDHQLDAMSMKAHLVSISIDPEQDTPARLQAYAQRFHARSDWQHYTGTLAASIAVQQAFGAYRGDKMNHAAVSFLRAAPGQPWVRLDGFATAGDLIREIHGFESLAAAR
jgi:protein SCO1/2